MSSPRLRFYRLLLLLFPGPFRDRWGAEMEHTALHRLGSAGSRPRRLLLVWPSLFADAVRGAAAERWLSRSVLPSLRPLRLNPTDLRHGLRSLRQAPGVSLVAVATLALAVSASTTVFSVLDTVVLDPLPYSEPDRIVSVWPEANFNVATVREMRQRVPALEHIAGVSVWTAVLAAEGTPEEIDVSRVSPSYFDVLRVNPASGRTFLPSEDRQDESDVVVLSHSLWASRFGSDPDLIGQQIDLSVADQRVHTVVGVLPAGFDPPEDAVAWVPLVDDVSLGVSDDPSWYVNSRIGRLAPGVTPEQASQQVASVARDLAPLVPNQFEEEQVTAAGVTRLKTQLVGRSKEGLLLLLGAVGLVLLIACVNLANLLLFRGENRRDDLRVRTALGAGRRDIVRLLLVESLALGLTGGALGVALALALISAVRQWAPRDVPRIDAVSLDWTVLGFALATTLGATLLSGLWPALRTSRGLVAVSRSAAGRSSSRSVSRTLVAVEVALAVVIALWSGLMIRSLDRLLSEPSGFEPQGVIAFRPNPLGSGREGAAEFRDFYRALLEEVRAAPGVRQAGAVQLLTGTKDNWSFPTRPEGYEVPASGALPDVNFRAVLPGYFETLRIPLLSGRTIESQDREGSEPIVVVNEAFAEAYWPDQSPIGKRLKIALGEAEWLRVVGVVGDVRQHALYLEPRPEIYVPYEAWPWEMSAWVVARTDQPDLFRAQVRHLVDRVDPDMPVSSVEHLATVLNRSASETGFVTLLLSAFSLLGVVLGAIGIYGVASYSVARRRAEYGVRLALGATRAGVLRTAIASQAPPILFGLVVGAALGLAGGKLFSAYLYRVEPTDPLTLAAVATVLGVVATLALLVPARRTGAIDPSKALASE